MRPLRYCYRLKEDVPFLSDTEADELSRLMDVKRATFARWRFNGTARREELEAAREAYHAAFERMTGHPRRADAAYDDLRASWCGRACPACDRPFRTPRATFCAECGHELPAGERAGLLRP